MIGYLTGKIISQSRNPLIIDVSGVGYLVYVSLQHIANLINKSQVSLYIYTHVKDDSIDLYGFPTLEEHDLFMMLLTVPGVGPKSALTVIGQGVSQIKNAISTTDVNFFTAIPRLGRKNAQKIIIELKSKIGSSKDLDLSGAENEETKEIVEVLASMGFAKKEIIPALKKLTPENDTPEKKLRQMLKILGKKVK